MANPIAWLLSKLFAFFASLSKEDKEKIIKFIVKQFEYWFRRYYQSRKGENGSGSRNKKSEEPNSSGEGVGA